MPRRSHPLLSPFPLAVMLLALLVLAFAFAMAALHGAGAPHLGVAPSAHTLAQGQLHAGSSHT